MSAVEQSPSNTTSFLLVLKTPNKPHMLGELTSIIESLQGAVVGIDTLESCPNSLVRAVNVEVPDADLTREIVAAVANLADTEVMAVSDSVFQMHLGGKIHVTSRFPLTTREDLSQAYTPGVARVSMAIHYKPELSFNLTIRNNTVAVVSDGTAVLGLGDIGPAGAMPVMEGKAMLFKEFGGVDAFPICLDTKDPDEIVAIVKALAPTFGGINLEDISAPRCFEIEERLKAELDIPVFHDDQHGTAVVVLAALLNASRLIGKPLSEIKVVMIGVGAAGIACTRIMMEAGVSEIVGCDRAGILYRGRTENMNSMKQWFADHTNPAGIKGDIVDAARGADLFLGLSGPGLFPVEALKAMNPDPIIFALANPTPEIDPRIAIKHARILATGRSDLPNQINNVLCFPGIFRGALNVRATGINEAMKLAAAHAIADVIQPNELSEEYIIPSVFNENVGKRVADAVAQAAIESGVARLTEPCKGVSIPNWGPTLPDWK